MVMVGGSGNPQSSRMRRCSHSAAAFGGFNRQRLDGVGLEELAGLLPFFGALANALARGHHE